MSARAPSEGGEARAAGRALPKRAEIEARRARFGLLAAAARGVAQAGSDAAELGPDRARALDSALRVLEQHVRAAELAPPDAPGREHETRALHDELVRVDAGLAQYADAIRAALEAVDLGTLRETLPALERGERETLLSLLDLLLEDEERLAARGDLVDFLVTFLSTEDQGGDRRVARDPATLTPGIRALAERMAAEHADALPALEREFVEATRRCRDAALEDVVHAMRQRKIALGPTLLAPQVLRAVVFYNATLWNVQRRSDARTLPPREPVAPRAPLRPPATETAAAAGTPAGTSAPEPPAEPGDVRWKVDALPVEPPRVEDEGDAGRERRFRLVLGTAGAVAVLGILLFLVFGGPQQSVHVLSPGELHAVSSDLQSGYRDKSPSGSLFVGTVEADWKALSPQEREQRARAIIAGLQRSGIREVMLYDADHRLVVHHADSLPLRVAQN